VKSTARKVKSTVHTMTAPLQTKTGALYTCDYLLPDIGQPSNIIEAGYLTDDMKEKLNAELAEIQSIQYSFFHFEKLKGYHNAWPFYNTNIGTTESEIDAEIAFLNKRIRSHGEPMKTKEDYIVYSNMCTLSFGLHDIRELNKKEYVEAIDFIEKPKSFYNKLTSLYRYISRPRDKGKEMRLMNEYKDKELVDQYNQEIKSIDVNNCLKWALSIVNVGRSEEKQINCLWPYADEYDWLKPIETVVGDKRHFFCIAKSPSEIKKIFEDKEDYRRMDVGDVEHTTSGDMPHYVGYSDSEPEDEDEDEDEDMVSDDDMGSDDMDTEGETGGGAARSKKLRKHKTRKHKTRKHKTRKHKTRKHKTRKHKTRKHKTQKHKTRKHKTQKHKTRKHKTRKHHK